MKKKFYITTPIYYPSGNLHIGHAYTTIAADLLARYKKEKGYDVYYLTGTDEHGEKIQKVASENNLKEKEYLDMMVEEIKNLWDAIGIEYDQFIRTTNKDHMQAVQKIFLSMQKKDDIYLDNYEGYYCTHCESFWTKSQLINDLCPDCNRVVEQRKEVSYFFNMKKYQNWIEDLYKDRENNEFFLQPLNRSNEMYENFIKEGIHDLAISRTSFNWGIPIDGTEHVIYVWLDALTNYITALGYQKNNDELFKKFWGTKEENNDTEIVHLVGKEIVRFHGIYWPIFLESLGLRQPTKLFAHGWILQKDGKMSKSKGNVISPYSIINNFGSDALRYYLMKEISFGSDGVFIPELFIEKFNADLVNSLSNLLYRTQTMINKNFETKLRTFSLEEQTSLENKICDYFLTTKEQIETYLDTLQIDKGFKLIFDLINRLNKYIDETTPWILAKESKIEELEKKLFFLGEMIVDVSILLKPFLPETAKEIQARFIPNSIEWEKISSIKNFSGKIDKIKPLYERIDIEEGLEKLA